MAALLEVTSQGIYCAAGDFHIDPWGAVERAVVTHAHADHAWPGSKSYLAARRGRDLLRARVGDGVPVETLEYGDPLDLRGVRVSFHPAGHILGSAQVRVEYRGEVWVVSGDYKLAPDPTCAPFEPVRCHVFVTESTFGLPIYRWPAERAVLDDIENWWRANQDAGRTSVLFAYALGKAQRVLAGLDAAIGPVYTHGAVERVNDVYRSCGVPLTPTLRAAAVADGGWSRALIVAPPSANGSPWLRRFGEISTGFVSGWMRIRGARRRRSLDRGFVLSDHADWPGLLQAVDLSGAERIWVTHGYRTPLVRWLQEKGLPAVAVETRFEGEQDETRAENAEAEA